MDGIGEAFLNVRETAKRLNVHENTVRNWAKAGDLPDARVPGSRYLRFRLEDVERLVAQRGKVVPSLEVERRMMNPELANAGLLAQWPEVDARDAQGQFPELVRRLLVETPGISNVTIRTGDGVVLPGYDRLADAQPSAFLPAGRLLLEFGTSKDPGRKATKDYKTRATEGPTSQVFVAMTPRRWPGKEAWVRA